MGLTLSLVDIVFLISQHSGCDVAASISIVLFFYALCVCKPTRAAKGVKQSCRDGDTVLAGFLPHLGRLEEEDQGDGEAQGPGRS
jgi:hypothetical protein